MLREGRPRSPKEESEDRYGKWKEPTNPVFPILGQWLQLSLFDHTSYYFEQFRIFCARQIKNDCSVFLLERLKS